MYLLIASLKKRDFLNILKSQSNFLEKLLGMIKTFYFFLNLRYEIISQFTKKIIDELRFNFNKNSGVYVDSSKKFIFKFYLDQKKR